MRTITERLAPATILALTPGLGWWWYDHPTPGFFRALHDETKGRLFSVLSRNIRDRHAERFFHTLSFLSRFSDDSISERQALHAIIREIIDAAIKKMAQRRSQLGTAEERMKDALTRIGDGPESEHVRNRIRSLFEEEQHLMWQHIRALEKITKLPGWELSGKSIQVFHKQCDNDRRFRMAIELVLRDIREN